MKFHFDGYALCEIDVDEEYPENTSANLLGIFQSRRDMAPFVHAVAQKDLRFHQQEVQRWGRRYASKMQQRRYITVPIGEIEESWWGGIEEAIQATALLLYKGYGKTVAA